MGQRERFRILAQRSGDTETTEARGGREGGVGGGRKRNHRLSLRNQKFYLVSDAVGVAKCPGQVLTDDTSVQPAR